MKSISNSFINIVILWAAIATAWLLGLHYNLFFVIWWYDIPLHFLGGVWVFFLVRYLFLRLGLEFHGNKNGFALFIFFISCVILVGVLWEFYEFISDRYIFHTGYTLLSGVYEDTLKDLFFDLAGGIVGYIVSSF